MAEVIHSGRYQDGEAWRGKHAIVVGTGNSGHDIAQDLCSSGAHVTMMQRSSTLVTNIEPSAQLAYAAYNEGTLDDNDLIATSMPLRLARRSHQMITEQSKQLDRPLLEALARIGFKLDYGEDDTGWQFNVRASDESVPAAVIAGDTAMWVRTRPTDAVSERPDPSDDR